MLSIISLFTDMASEMLYPVMPVYLKTIGFSVLYIGILEGIAEAVAGLSKSYFGKLSDNSGKRLPFVQLGYTLSALSKPMLAVSVLPLWIFVCRTLDRIGKGIRTGARDALLSDEATPETKASVFGFHRSMDTMGAVLGPALALLFLYYHPQQYKTLFLLASIPGILAITTSFFLGDKAKQQTNEASKTSFFSFLNYWKESPTSYKKLLIGLLAFALFNSSDVFLLLKLKQSGLSDTLLIGVYIFYNLSYALLAFPVGILADKIGLKQLYLTGIIAFVLVYFFMAREAGSLYFYLFLFLLYGYFAAATEGIAKAWITNISENKDTATAIGTYSGLQSICALFASVFAGWLWYNFSPVVTFMTTAIMALVVLIYLAQIPYKKTAMS